MPAASGAKGFRSILQSNRFGGWRSFLPSMESLEEASDRYAHLYPGAKTKVTSGKWDAAELALDWHVEAGECPRFDCPDAPPPDPCSSADFSKGAPGVHGIQRGFINRSGPDSGNIPNTRCFASATAQALFACESILGFLRRHSSARRGSPSSGVDVADSYACAMAGACEMVYPPGRAPITPEEHSL